LSERTISILIRILMIIPFAIGGIALFIAGVKFSNRSFIVYYPGNFLTRFIGDLIRSTYAGSCFICIFAGFTIFLNYYHMAMPNAMILPFSICVGIILLPIEFVSDYFHSILRQSHPLVNRDTIDIQTPPPKHELFDIIKVKPRRVVIYTAAVAPMTAFLVVYLSFYTIGWVSLGLVGIVSSFFLSGLYSFGVFMAISVKIISRQLLRLRNGESS
jgi:hypothetical protein